MIIGPKDPETISLEKLDELFDFMVDLTFAWRGAEATEQGRLRFKIKLHKP